MDGLPTECSQPYLTLNAFGHYVMAEDARERRAILRDMKFPHVGKRSQYSAATQAIIRFLAGGGRDAEIIHRAVERLASGTVTGRHDAVRRRICREALSCFLSGVDSLRLDGLIAARSDRRGPRIRAGGVIISCCPELTIRGTIRKKAVVGAIKLRLCKSPTLSEEAGSLSATILRHWVERAEAGPGEHPDRRLCRVVDVFNGNRMHEAPSSVKRRREQVVSTCEEIALLWPSIERATAKRGNS